MNTILISQLHAVSCCVACITCLSCAVHRGEAAGPRDQGGVSPKATALELLRHVDKLPGLLEAVGKMDAPLEGLIKPETMGVEATGEISNNRLETLNGNRVLSGNSSNTKTVNVLSDLDIEINITISPPDTPNVKLDSTDAAASRKQAKTGQNKKRRKLREEFQSLDADGDGTITWKEYRSAMQDKEVLVAEDGE